MKEMPWVVVRGLLVWDDRLLFLKRAQHKQYPNAWNLPGGKVEWGESLKRAVIRETQEETGLHLYTPTFLGMKEYLPSARQPRHVIAFYYHGPHRRNEVTINDESSNYCWVTRKQLKRLPLSVPNRAFLLSLFDRVV